MNSSLTPAQMIGKLKSANEAHVVVIVNQAANIHERFYKYERIGSAVLDILLDGGRSSSFKNMCNFMSS